MSTHEFSLLSIAPPHPAAGRGGVSERLSGAELLATGLSHGTKEQRFSVETTFTYEISGSRDCKSPEDAAAALALYSPGKWVLFADKFRSICVLDPLKQQASFPFQHL